LRTLRKAFAPLRLVLRKNMPTSNITHQTSLSAHVVLLCRFLRKKSFQITSTEEADGLRAISLLPINAEVYFREALRSVLCKSQLQYHKFNEYYDEFKAQLKKAADSKVKELPEKKPKPEKKSKEAQFEALKDWLNMSATTDEKAVASFSALEVLTKKDFLDLSEDEMRLMMRVLTKLARKLAHQKSRLRKKSKRQKELDLLALRCE